jgi:hypothetical protein
MEVLLGVDWAEEHHDLCLLDDPGQVLARRRIPKASTARRRCMPCSPTTLRT